MNTRERSVHAALQTTPGRTAWEIARALGQPGSLNRYNGRTVHRALLGLRTRGLATSRRDASGQVVWDPAQSAPAPATEPAGPNLLAAELDPHILAQLERQPRSTSTDLAAALMDSGILHASNLADAVNIICGRLRLLHAHRRIRQHRATQRLTLARHAWTVADGP